MPRVSAANKKVVETAEQPVGQEQPRPMSTEGPAVIAPSVVEPTDKPVNTEWAEMMKFAKDPITFVINEATDKNAENPVLVFNSGDVRKCFRGKEYTLERRFIESLARAKVTSYSQETKEINGIKTVVNVGHTAGRYPFRVIHDPHPRGADWLKAILLEA